MEPLPELNGAVSPAEPPFNIIHPSVPGRALEGDFPYPPPTKNHPLKYTLKRLRGGFLFVLGYLLSPLSWWNDLFFNLPFAYGFGYLASRFSPGFFLPAAIAGYWLSNVAGILLMQLGIMDVAQGDAKRNFKQEVLTGVLSSTVYTLIILGLIHAHILETPGLALGEGTFSWSALLPFGGDR